MKNLSNPFYYMFALFLYSLSFACDTTVDTEGDSPLISEGTTGESSKWAFNDFQKVDDLNPILQPSEDLLFIDPVTGKSVRWEARNVLNPAAVVKGDTVYLFYRAQDQTGTSRIGLATSTDGLHFTKRATPVFYPDRDAQNKLEWNYKKATDYDQPIDPSEDLFDGAEDPRIVERADGVYIMTYTAYDGRTARLAVASSTDLVHWQKHGLAFVQEKYRQPWSKSGAIVVEQDGERMIAKKIEGKYWMYYGDTNIFMATSDDLLSWTVAENSESQQQISVLHPRMGYFDSRLVEPGPYALWRADGILFIYNGSNAKTSTIRTSPFLPTPPGRLCLIPPHRINC